MGMRRGALTKDLGATGLEQSFGYIRADFLQEWNGQKRTKTITEMVSNSAVIGALRYVIEQSLREMTWTVNSEEGEDDPRVELINEAVDNMTHSVNDHIADVALMPFYGFALFTLTYEKVGGRLLWRKFKQLGPDTIQRWILADDGGIEGVQQWPHLWPESIPIERMLLYRFRKYLNNPEGESILRPAFINWYAVKNLQQIENIGHERNVAGMPVIMPPMGADMEGTDGDTAELIVRNVRNDQQAGLVLPPPIGEGDHQKWHFELQSAPGGTKSTDLDRTISRNEKRILMTALAQFLMIGQDNVGALATFEGGTDLFNRSVNALADNIAATFTQYAIPRLLEYNGIPDASGITLEHTPADNYTLGDVSQFLQQLGGALTLTAEDQVWIRDLANMPAKSVEEIERIMEEEQQRKDAQAAAMRDAMQRRPEPDVDENAAVFAADAYEDDVQRLERKMQRKIQSFQKQQREKILSEFDA